jgi:hypothetical protein
MGMTTWMSVQPDAIADQQPDAIAYPQVRAACARQQQTHIKRGCSTAAPSTATPTTATPSTAAATAAPSHASATQLRLVWNESSTYRGLTSASPHWMVHGEVVPFYVSVAAELPSSLLVTCRASSSDISVCCNTSAALGARVVAQHLGCTFNASRIPRAVYAVGTRNGSGTGPVMVGVRCADSSGNGSDSVDVSVLALVTPIVAGLDGRSIEPCDDRCDQRRHQSRLEIITSTTREVMLNAPSDGTGAFAQPVSVKLRRVDRSGEAENLKSELPLTITNVSNTSLVVRLPLFNETCGQNGSICYFSMEIANPSVIDDVTAGGIFLCPDPNRSDNPTTRCAGHVLSQAIGTMFHTVRYVSACAGFERPGNVCLEPDSMENTPCAFGFGDSCTRCPKGGICPGGNEVRSQVGYDAHTTAWSGRSDHSLP